MTSLHGTDYPRVTSSVPFATSVATAAGAVAARWVCSLCGEEITLDLEPQHLDAIATLAMLEANPPHPAMPRTVVECAKLHNTAAGVAAAAVPDVVRITVWMLTHTTKHHADVMGRSSPAPAAAALEVAR